MIDETDELERQSIQSLPFHRNDPNTITINQVPDVPKKPLYKPHETDKLSVILGYHFLNIAIVLILFAFINPWLIFTQPDPNILGSNPQRLEETYGFFQTCTSHSPTRPGTPPTLTCSPFPTLESCGGTRFPQIGWFTCSQVRVIRLAMYVAMGPLVLASVALFVQLWVFCRDEGRVRKGLRRTARYCVALGMAFVVIALGYAALYRSYLEEKNKVGADVMEEGMEWGMGVGWMGACLALGLLFVAWVLLGRQKGSVDQGGYREVLKDWSEGGSVMGRSERGDAPSIRSSYGTMAPAPANNV